MDISRRDFLGVLALSPVFGAVRRGGAGSAPPLELARNAFIVEGRPRFLIGGSIDYFRCPHELWRDRLLKAKRAGLNAIATCIAWNFHEREEGVCDFTGDHDLGRFLDLCNELGLFVFVRPGPFVCDEWEAGGYPAWLIAKHGIETRTNHPPTLAFVRRWFEQLIPRIASRQVGCGGSVILVQQENEFYFVGRPGIREYQDFLISTLREFGIVVPITDCSGFHAETRRPESLQTVNGWSQDGVARLRERQPDKPAIVSEFYTHWIECWGLPEEAGPGAAALGRQTAECLAAGGMPFYFMFHGGTSFGEWPSRTWKTDYSFMLPRYYGRGPIAEGGALNDTYFAVKAATLAAQSIEDALAGSEPIALPVMLTGSLQGTARRSERGTILFLTGKESGGRSYQRGEITLSSGRRLELAYRPDKPAILPFALQIDAGRTIDFTNAALIGASETAIVVRGEEGLEGMISINGEVVAFSFASKPVLVKAGPTVIVGVPEDLADRTWLADGRVIVGPAYVGERSGDQHECWCDKGTKDVHVITKAGTLQTVLLPAPTAGDRDVPSSNWRAFPFPEIRGEGEWSELDAPRPVEDLGAPWGCTWYRAHFTCDTPRRSALWFTQASDRIHVFSKGRRIGIWGRGEGASRDSLPVDLSAGDNSFVFLCDNMGRISEGSCLDHKGINGPVYLDAHEAEVSWTASPSPESPPSESWRFQTYRDMVPGKHLWRSTGTFELAPGHAITLSLRALPQYAWVEVNGTLVGEHGGELSLIDGVSFSTHEPSDVAPGRVTVRMTFHGDKARDIRDHVHVFTYPKDRPLVSWGFRPWSVPDCPGEAAENQPVCWECQFPKPRLSPPLFFDPEGLSKGRLFLNERAVGRYWKIGPQKSLYLPEPWLEDQNRLVVFDEDGLSPERTRLVRDARVPSRIVII